MVTGIELDGQVGLVLFGVGFDYLGLVGASGQFPEVDAGAQRLLDLRASAQSVGLVGPVWSTLVDEI